MKNLILFAVFTLGSWWTLQSQNCNAFVPTEKGAEWEITNYSPKGKVQGSTRYMMKNVKTSGSEVTFEMSSTTYDKKGKELLSNDLEAFCKNGVFEFDMSFFFDEEMMGGMSGSNIEMKMEMSSLVMPSEKNRKGDQLPDGNIYITMDMPGMGEMNMEFSYINRIIEESKESVTVPAGTYECIVLSQEMKMKTIVEMTTKSREYYCENVGMVRSESFNQNGKLTGYAELTMMK